MSAEPRLVFFEDLHVGMEMWGTEETADRNEMIDYAERYDPWPMHLGDEGAARTPFGRLTASGGYVIGLWYRSGHGIWHRPDWTAAFLGSLNWQVAFPQPLHAGEIVRTRTVITHMRLSSKPGRGVVSHTSDLVNGTADVFLTVDVVFLIATRPVTGAG